MIDKIEIIGNDYTVGDQLKKYIKKRLGKLDKYLPRGSKKDVVLKVVIESIGHQGGDRYEVSVAMEIPGGKVLTARDECTNVFAGIDLVEAKLTSQIRRFKLESQPHRQKSLKNLFRRRKNS